MAEEYQVQLEIFEGPMDLLLHLIRKNKVDIYDIPIAFIMDQYLAYLDIMRSLNIDVAGEFLEMAATLAYIKSRLLVPRIGSDDDEQEED
ncbi:MAG: segregation/condensation protein A, partial [Syntrophobacterales bacterium]